MTGRAEASRSPDLTEVMRVVMDEAQDEMFVSLPGVVVKYNPAQQKADVKPLLQKNFLNDDGTEGLDDLPVLPEVPIQFPRGGGYYLSFPLVPGDNVLLVFVDKSIDAYMAGDGKKPVDPVDLRNHDISDAVAFPCMFPFSRAIKDDVASGAVFGKEKGAQIRATGSAMEVTTGGLPASAGGFVALATKVIIELGKISTAIAALGGSYTPGPVASSNLKAD
jgi:hypothetical protein